MNLDTPVNQVKALSGVFLASNLARQIAYTGQCDKAAANTILVSLLNQTPQNIDDVYGNVRNLTQGFDVLISQLAGEVSPSGVKPDADVTRYAVSILHLEKKLSSNPETLSSIGSSIEKAKQQLQYFSIDHPNTIARLADIYQQTISPLGPRILVNGEHIHLSNQENANKIRALLLGGIRFAVLFRQCKGSKFRLLFKRKAYLRLARQLLEQHG